MKLHNENHKKIVQINKEDNAIIFNEPSSSLYIAYLGLKTILNARKTTPIAAEDYQIRNISLFKSYRQGFMSTILNPKAILFYISILSIRLE